MERTGRIFIKFYVCLFFRNPSRQFKLHQTVTRTTDTLLENIRTFMIIVKCIHIVRVVKSRRMSWAGHVERMGKDRGVYRVLVGKHEGKRPLGRPRCRWEDNIKMDLQEVGRGHGDWMELAQDRDRWRALVGTVRDFRVP